MGNTPTYMHVADIHWPEDPTIANTQDDNQEGEPQDQDMENLSIAPPRDPTTSDKSLLLSEDFALVAASAAVTNPTSSTSNPDLHNPMMVECPTMASEAELLETMAMVNPSDPPLDPTLRDVNPHTLLDDFSPEDHLDDSTARQDLTTNLAITESITDTVLQPHDPKEESTANLAITESITDTAPQPDNLKKEQLDETKAEELPSSPSTTPVLLEPLKVFSASFIKSLVPEYGPTPDITAPQQSSVGRRILNYFQDLIEDPSTDSTAETMESALSREDLRELARDMRNGWRSIGKLSYLCNIYCINLIK